jgi:hypothetical protein
LIRDDGELCESYAKERGEEIIILFPSSIAWYIMKNYRHINFEYFI